MRQQFFETARGLRGQALEHILEVAIWIVAVELCELDQAHDGGGALSGTQRTREEPVGSAESDWSDAVFEMVVVCALSKVHESSG